MIRKSADATVRWVIPGHLWASWHSSRLTQMYAAKTFDLNNVGYSIIGFNSNTRSGGADINNILSCSRIRNPIGL